MNKLSNKLFSLKKKLYVILAIQFFSIALFSMEEQLPSIEGTESKEPTWKKTDYATVLMDAIRGGDLPHVSILFRREKMPVYDAMGRTPLYVAVLYGHKAIVNYLIREGADINGPNYRRFKSRSVGERRKSLSASRPGLSKLQQLGRISGLDVDLLSSQKWQKIEQRTIRRKGPENRLSVVREHSNENNLDVIKAEGGIWGSIKVDDATPLFALVQKPEINSVDLEIAEILLRNGANLEAKNTGLRTPIDEMEIRLLKLAKSDMPCAPRIRHDFNSARALYLRGIKNLRFRSGLLSTWYLFADSHTTARVIELHQAESIAQNDESELITDTKGMRLSFLNGMITWEIDVFLPSPREAYERYLQVKKSLDEPSRFSMILNYLALWTELQRNGDGTKCDTQEPFSFLEVVTHPPRQVADAIFAVHRDMFLAINPKWIAIKYCRDEGAVKLQRFINRIAQLNNLVAFSIVKSEKQEERFLYWHQVAQKLIKRGDLFGAWGVLTGLNSMPVSRVLPKARIDGLPDLQKYESYVQTKKERLEYGPIIPDIIHEGAYLRGFFEKKCLDNKTLFSDESSLSITLSTFIGEFTDLQNQLRKVEPVIKRNWLYNYFYHLSAPELEENAAELVSLHSARRLKVRDASPEMNETPMAEYWETQEFYEWLQSQKLGHLVDDLVKGKIVDGKTMLEQYAFAHSAKYSEMNPQLFMVLGCYGGWCAQRNTEPLANINQDAKFPANLWAARNSSFEWIMWLRNKKLTQTIRPLFNHGIVTFNLFIDARRSDREPATFYSRLGIEEDGHRILDKLFFLATSLEPASENIRRWRIKDLDLWLFQRGLSHLIPLLKRDGAWSSDHFLAAYFVWQKFREPGMRTLGLNRDWTSKIFEALAPEFNIVKAIEQEGIGPITSVEKQERHSRMFFIELLYNLNAIDALPKFYEDGIRSLAKLKQKLPKSRSQSERIPAGVPVLHEVDLMLVRYGLDKDQIQKLRKLLLGT